LTVQNPDQPVPPGLEVTGIIEYTAKSNQEQRETIVVDIDGKEIQISLRAFPARAELSVDGKHFEFVRLDVHLRIDNEQTHAFH
jgi:hypothetical protein